jgi:hypothetical protein
MPKTCLAGYIPLKEPIDRDVGTMIAAWAPLMSPLSTTVPVRSHQGWQGIAVRSWRSVC